jgi:hypothetical protein
MITPSDASLLVPKAALKKYRPPEGVAFTPTSLLLPPDLLPEQWAELGDHIAAAGKAWGVWMGDWMKHGRANYDETFVALTVGQMDLPLHGVERFELQAGVAPENRPVDFDGQLTPEHLLVVSKRCPDEEDRKRWLETAAEMKLSPRELQASIRAGAAMRIDTEKRRLSFPSPGAVRRAFDDWWQGLGDSWQKTWTLEDCEAVLAELQPIKECIEQVLLRKDALRFGPVLESARAKDAKGAKEGAE